MNRPLLAILLLAAALRLLYATAPYLDAHRWRQVDTAAIARNFAEVSLNPFYPRVDWGGPDAFVEAEFPLLPWLAGVVYRVAGVDETLGRFIVIGFAVGLVWAVYRLVLSLEGGRPAASAAAFLMAVSPSAVFFGRTFMPDTPMLFFAVVALTGFVDFARSGASRALVLGSTALGLAILVKIPAVVIVPAILVTLWRAGRLATFREPRVLAALTIPMICAAAWYWHAQQLYAETGLTFGILGAPAKTYPPWISPGPWPSVFSKWSTTSLIVDPDFYERLLARLYHFVLTPAGFVLAVLGAITWRARARATIDIWLVTMVAFVLAAGAGHLAHDYYQLPFAAIGAVYFGCLAAPVFDRAWLGSSLPRRLVMGSVIAALGVVSFYYSNVMQSHFRVGNLDTRLADAGRAVDNRTGDGTLTIVVDDYGVTSPLLLYYARLKGWSFDPGDLSPALIERLRERGARYFVTTQWSQIRERAPDAAAVLEGYAEVPLDRPPGDTVMLDLRLRR